MVLSRLLCLPAFPACISWDCWGHGPILFCVLVHIPGPERTGWNGTLAMPGMHLDSNFMSVCCSFPPKPTYSGFPAEDQ